MSAIEFTAERLESFELPRARHLPPSPRVGISIQEIQSAVAAHFNLSHWHLVGQMRYATIARARHVAMYFARTKTGASYPEIGLAFGKRDHTTVMDAVKKIQTEILRDPKVREEIAGLDAVLEHGRSEAASE